MRVWVVEDEPLARARLTRMVTELGHEVEGFADAASVRAVLAQRLPEAVLLDIALPGEDGLSLGRMIDALPQPPAVVFVTAYPQHALEAFSVHPVDYLVKPVSRERLAQALQAVQRLRLAPVAASPGEPVWVFRLGRRSERVPQSAIRYFQAEDKVVWAHTTMGTFACDAALETIAQRVGEGFVRTHRSLLVARGWIEAVVRKGLGGEVVLRDGTRLPVSRRHFSAVQQALGQ